MPKGKTELFSTILELFENWAVYTIQYNVPNSLLSLLVCFGQGVVSQVCKQTTSVQALGKVLQLLKSSLSIIKCVFSNEVSRIFLAK